MQSACSVAHTFRLQELLYLWNGLNILGKDQNLVKPVLAEIEAVLRQDQSKNGTGFSPYSYPIQLMTTYPFLELDGDDYCLALMLKAMCLKHLQSPFQAEQCLTEVVT